METIITENFESSILSNLTGEIADFLYKNKGCDDYKVLLSSAIDNDDIITHYAIVICTFENQVAVL